MSNYKRRKCSRTVNRKAVGVEALPMPTINRRTRPEQLKHFDPSDLSKRVGGVGLHWTWEDTWSYYDRDPDYWRHWAEDHGVIAA